MQVAQVIEGVNRILVEEFELDEASITPDADLREDLDLDSLDAVDLIVAIERVFGVRLEDKVVMQMRTVRDIHDYVHSEAERVQA